MRKTEQQKALDTIKTVKYGTTIKEIDRLHSIIRRLAKHMDHHDELCAGTHINTKHEPCGMCVDIMR